MPRQANLIPTVERKISIPHTLSEAVDMRLFSPALGKPGYGELSKLVTELLDAWVKRTPLNPVAEKMMEQKKLQFAAEL